MSKKAQVEKAKRREGVTFAEPVKEAEQKVSALAVVSKPVLDWKKISKLDSAPEYSRACEVLTAVKEKLNEAEKERKQIVDPLNGVVKHVNAKFKPYTEALKDIEGHLKFLVVGYLEEQRALAVKLAEKEAKAAEKKGAKQLAEDIREHALTSMPVPASSAVSFRKRWAYKVVDAKKVPREYLCVDSDAVNAAIKAGEREIPGLEIYEDTIAAVSA